AAGGLQHAARQAVAIREVVDVVRAEIGRDRVVDVLEGDAEGASQQALGSVVMGGMIAVVILALLMVPVFFVSVQRVLGGDRAKAEKDGEAYGPPAPVKP
ncbi:efflux RND transporter permease subunit, partial [Bradyrhizobium campsiandrae]|uniref:efflux RND transporter permease subunit n=1 Tax=Bradyrhizobium campsiandrae TaxID=1729892 RepID=UPI001FCF1988